MSTYRNTIASLLAQIFSILPIKQNKIVFTSFGGKYYNDAPRIISEALKNDEVQKVWIAKPNVELPDNIKKVSPSSIRAIYELETAKIWVDNSRKYEWAKKRNNQYYIQTWHGGVALKKVEADALESLSEYYIKRAKKDSGNIDYFV